MGERKIKECICDSTKKVNVENGKPLFPICLPFFLTNMTEILLADIDQRLMSDVPTVKTGDVTFDGKAPERRDIIRALSVLNGEDFMRWMRMSAQLQGFCGWFMEQEEPDGDDEELTMWYDIDFLAKKWNEYAVMANGISART